MTQEKLLSQVGEEIDHDLAAKMVKDYQEKYPTMAQGYFVGREIIERILSQPDCHGINFYNGLDNGKQTLVSVGVNSHQQLIAGTVIGDDGKMTRGIVADRSASPAGGDDGSLWFW